MPSSMLLLTSFLFRVDQVTKIDSDKVLLDIASVAMAKYARPAPCNIEKPQGTDVAMLIKPPMALPTKNVAAYMAGYLLKKIPPNDCSECSEQLVLPELPPCDELSVYEFIRNKTNQESGCLTYPTQAMVSFVQKIEEIFCGTFEQIIYMPFLLARLCKSADEECQFLKCKELKCSHRLKSMLKLYMKVRMYHALKKNNMQIVEDKSVKRNRKMLKLSHL